MAGLDPAIHAFTARTEEDVDARGKPGHDDLEGYASTNSSRRYPCA
ncbi:hypothetical protein IQ17_03845 [Bradyrhizobium daqingense]|uniref:Uncharacterized protein n=1 Tax=Bradyrhizobium daqingense TaxID=993502 RepID=A0A562L8K3_9BRAD|nr:hypothetical protein IQ17_03845 [Bradyrhizobium daqingense]